MMLDDLIKNSQDAIRHIDDVAAKKLLKEVGNFLLSQNIQQADPVLFQKLQTLIVQLKIVNFPNLSENDAADILRNHYLDSYAIEVPMENRITAMLFFYPEIPRDDLRKKLKKALLENQQKLGPLSVGQWIQEFEKMFDIRIRNISASVEFVSRHPKAIFLNPTEKSDLKDLLYTYDYLLTTTLPATGPVLKQILSVDPEDKSSYQSTESYTQNKISTLDKRAIYRDSDAQFFTNLPINEALKQFPELGEQLITSEKIALKNFPDPVRPSIKNWLSDYTYTLGHETKGAIERGNYIFQSVNGRKLTSGERQKLAYILSSADENRPVTVNKDLKQIIFPVVKTEPQKTVSQPNLINRTAPAKPEPPKSPDVRQANPYQAAQIKPASPKANPPQINRFNQPAPTKSEPQKTSINFGQIRRPSPISAKPLHIGANSQLSGSSARTELALTDWGTRQAFQAPAAKPSSGEARILEIHRAPAENKPPSRETAPIDSFARQRQEIFSRTEAPVEQKSIHSPSSKPEATISFSSPQKMSFEKKIDAPTPSQPPRNKPIHIYPFFPAKDNERDNRIQSQNVINLKE